MSFLEGGSSSASSDVGGAAAPKRKIALGSSKEGAVQTLRVNEKFAKRCVDQQSMSRLPHGVRVPMFCILYTI